jgi:uncharacterized protein YgiB involved in biofilm formation
MAKRRRSQHIVLALIGAAALPACTPVAQQRAVHDRYASREDCAADWGRPEVCDQDDDSRPMAHVGGPRVVYRGPSYPEGDRPQAQYEARKEALRLGALDAMAPGAGNHAIEQSVPTRGGFGASAHHFGRLG